MKAVRNYFSVERAKLREMNFTEKRQYIWEYYKLQMFVTLFGLLIIGSFINSVFINPPKDDYLHIAWMAFPLHFERLNIMRDNLDVILVDPSRTEIAVRCYSLTGDFQIDQAVITQLHARLMIGEIDAGIITREQMLEMAEAGMIRPMDGVLYDLNRLFPYLDAEERLEIITYDFLDEGYVTNIVGINLANSNIINEMDVRGEYLYFVIMINSATNYRTAKALGLLLNEQWEG